MFKKLLTLCLVLLMVSLPCAASQLVDIQGDRYEKEISLLHALGIVEGKEGDLYMPADNLTRAEMTTIVLRLMQASANTQATFADVSADHWANKIIGTAAQLGIVNGVSQTEFKPEEAVTFPQAVKMLVSTLGYAVHADALGGYPSGYMAKAAQLGILNGTSDNGGAISRGTMAKLVANALEVNILVRTGYGSSYTFEEKPGATLLNTYMDIEVFEGKITANETLNLGGTAAGKGEIVIADKVIKEGETKAANYIGRAAVVYAKEDADSLTALYVQPKANSTFIVVEASDILPKSTLSTVYYETEDDTLEVQVASDAVWVYNGQIKTDMTPMQLLFDTGYISFSAPDAGEADTVFVYSFKNMVVDKVRTDLHTVSFKNRSEGISSLTLDTTDSSKKFSLQNTDGTKATLEELNEWDVLSVAQSQDGSTLQIIRSVQYVAGKVTEIGDTSATINGTKYEIAANALRNPELNAPSLEMEANFFLDYAGKIVAADTESFKDFKYGYLVAIGKDKGIDGEEQVKIFTEDAEMKIFKLSNNFRLNNVPTEELISDTDTVVYAGGKAKEQLIRFKANSENVLLSMETAWDIKENRDQVSEEERLEKFTEEKYLASAGLYGTPMRMYDFQFLLRQKSKVFQVPTEYEGDDSAYSMIDPMSIGHVTDYGSLPYTTFYDIDEDNVISVMVTVGGGGDTLETVGVVTKVATTLDEEGAAVRSMKVITNSGEASIIIEDGTAITLGQYALTDKNIEDNLQESGAVAETISADDIAVGDIVWYANPDLSGASDNIRIILRAESPLVGRRNFTSGNADRAGVGAYPGYIFTYAKVEHVSQYGAKVKVPSALNSTALDVTTILSFEDTRTAIWLYDSRRQTFTKITTADIQEEDKIFSFRNNLREFMMVVYR